MKKHLITTLAATIGLTFSASAVDSAENVDCSKVRETIQAQAKKDGANILEIVQRAIAANESCYCEIVKAAIASSDSSTDAVAAIVETAIATAPDKVNQIAQCAISVAPDASTAIRALLADRGSVLNFPRGPIEDGAPEVHLQPYMIFDPVAPALTITPPDVTSVNP